MSKKQQHDQRDPDSIRNHSGNKYIRKIYSCHVPTNPQAETPSIEVDVYGVLDAFPTGSAAIDHAVKKLLCSGIRGKADRRQDLSEAIDAIRRAIQIEKTRQERATYELAGGQKVMRVTSFVPIGTGLVDRLHKLEDKVRKTLPKNLENMVNRGERRNKRRAQRRA